MTIGRRPGWPWWASFFHSADHVRSDLAAGGVVRARLLFMHRCPRCRLLADLCLGRCATDPWFNR